MFKALRVDKVFSDDGAAVFDWGQVNECADGDPEMEAVLFDIFSRNLEVDLQALEDSFSSGDYEGWDAAVHKLYGACAHIGAVSMAAVCDRAQLMGEDAKPLMQELHIAIMSEAKKLRAFLEQRSAV